MNETTSIKFFDTASLQRFEVFYIGFNQIMVCPEGQWDRNDCQVIWRGWATDSIAALDAVSGRAMDDTRSMLAVYDERWPA